MRVTAYLGLSSMFVAAGTARAWRMIHQRQQEDARRRRSRIRYIGRARSGQAGGRLDEREMAPRDILLAA